MKNKRLYTTFSKLTFFFVAFGLIPLFALSLLFFFRYSGIVRDSMTGSYAAMNGYISKNVAAVLENIDDSMGELYEYENSYGDTLADILKDDTLDQKDREAAVQSLLRRILARSRYISSLRMVDYRGTVYNVYYKQDKVLRNEAVSRISMEVYSPQDDLTEMKLFGTFPESEMTINSDDYIFSMVRNYMDTSRVETALKKPLGTLFADVNIEEVRSIVQKSSIDKGHFYIYSTSTDQYIYSDAAEDYLNGAHPLSFCEALLDGSSGTKKIDGRWVFYNKIEGVEAYAVLVLTENDIMGTFFRSRMILFLIACFACAVLLVFYTRFSVRMSEPTRRLKEAMDQVREGNLDVRVNLDTHDEMEYVADGFNRMAEQLGEYIEQVYVAQICQKDAELNALKMQIQPHYLYNTLDVIRMTALEQDDKKTAGLLESLAHQLRYVMGTQSDRVYLRDELDAVREYFVITKVRYEDRFSLMIYAADEDLDLVVPKLLLQPVIENAIKHGLRDKEGYGAVAVRAERKQDHLEIVVMDDGIGMEQEQVEHMQEVLDDTSRRTAVSDGSVSIGMQNVYDRIKLNCGREYGFTIQSTRGVGTIVTYHLPIWEEL